MENSEIENAFDLDKTNRKSKKVTDYIHKKSTDYNRSPSNVLLAITNGSIGFLLAFALSLIYEPAKIWITGSFFIAIGAAFSIYKSRGKEWAKIEDEIDLKVKHINIRKLEIDALNSIIEQLPDGTPQSLKDEIFKKYSKLLDSNE